MGSPPRLSLTVLDGSDYDLIMNHRCSRRIVRSSLLRNGSRSAGLFLLGLLLAGCAARQGPIPVLGTAAHHTDVGMRLLELGKLEQANREFLLARNVDPTFSPAFVGTAMVDRRQKEFTRAFAELAEAKKNARTPAQLIAASAQFIETQRQAYLHGQAGRDWLKVSEQEFAAGVGQDENLSSLYYAMGRAYLTGYEFSKAEEMFRKITPEDGSYFKQATTELAILQKVKQFLKEGR